jgi:hypothetical protein
VSSLCLLFERSTCSVTPFILFHFTWTSSPYAFAQGNRQVGIKIKRSFGSKLLFRESLVPLYSPNFFYSIPSPFVI